MGEYCPKCEERFAIVRNITVDGEGARKAEDVIAQKLSCGHTVGGEKFEAFKSKVAEIKKSNREKILKIQEEERLAISKAATNVIIPGGVDGSE